MCPAFAPAALNQHNPVPALARPTAQRRSNGWKVIPAPMVEDVSTAATRDLVAVRDQLVPINKKWNIATLLDALRAYPGLSNSERITFEYVMLEGVNDTKEDAYRLVELLRGIPAKVNLIPFNEWPGAPYKRSSGNRIHTFADIIHKAGYASPIRTPRGEDIMAACGQLKSATERARKSRAEIQAEIQAETGLD